MVKTVIIHIMLAVIFLFNIDPSFLLICINRLWKPHLGSIRNWDYTAFFCSANICQEAGQGTAAFVIHTDSAALLGILLVSKSNISMSVAALVIKAIQGVEQALWSTISRDEQVLSFCSSDLYLWLICLLWLLLQGIALRPLTMFKSGFSSNSKNKAFTLSFKSWCEFSLSLSLSSQPYTPSKRMNLIKNRIMPHAKLCLCSQGIQG